MRIDFRTVTGVVVAAALALTTAAADMLKLAAVTDHADALYRIGEEAVFTVTASSADMAADRRVVRPTTGRKADSSRRSEGGLAVQVI